MARIQLLNAHPDGVDRRRKIRARVAIGNREHIDLVEMILRAHNIFDAGAQAAVQANTIQIPDTLRTALHASKYRDQGPVASRFGSDDCPMRRSEGSRHIDTDHQEKNSSTAPERKPACKRPADSDIAC